MLNVYRLCFLKSFPPTSSKTLKHNPKILLTFPVTRRFPTSFPFLESLGPIFSGRFSLKFMKMNSACYC